MIFKERCEPLGDLDENDTALQHFFDFSNQLKQTCKGRKYIRTRSITPTKPYIRLDTPLRKQLLPDLNDVDEAHDDEVGNEQAEENGEENEIKLVRKTRKRKASQGNQQGCCCCWWWCLCSSSCCCCCCGGGVVVL